MRPEPKEDSIPARVFGKTAAREAVTLAEEVVRVVRALMYDVPRERYLGRIEAFLNRPIVL